MPKLRSLDLFSGAGGFALGLQRFAVPVAYCDIDREAVEVLEKRMSDRQLPRAPILGDISKVRPSDIQGPIDLITAGFPCPDVSVIGKRNGIQEGTRTVLVHQVFRLVKSLKPSYVFLENVSAITNDKDFPAILKKISGLGYDWAYDFFTASREGAVHQRDRWLLLAIRRSPDPISVRPSCSATLKANLRIRRSSAVCSIDDPYCRQGRRFYKLYGNALVPAVACTAFCELYERLNGNELGEKVPRGNQLDWSSAVANVSGQMYEQERREKGDCVSKKGFLIIPRKSVRGVKNTQPLIIQQYRRMCLPTPRLKMAVGALTARTKSDLGPTVIASQLCPKHLRNSKKSRIDVGFLENMMGFPRRWSR